jgi:hypothetical protein
MRRLVWLLAPLLAAAGCMQAPPEVQVAQRVKAKALKHFLVQDAKIDGVVAGLWKGSRDKEAKAKADSVARAAVAEFGQGPDKTLTGAQVVELAQAILAEDKKFERATDAVMKRIKTLRDMNAKNLIQHAQLEAALNDYLEAGIDEAVIDELGKYLIEAVRAAGGE